MGISDLQCAETVLEKLYDWEQSYEPPRALFKQHNKLDEQTLSIGLKLLGQYNLIKVTKDNVEPHKFIIHRLPVLKDASRMGGFKKYLEHLNNEKSNTEKQMSSQDELIMLQTEKLRYEQTIRDQNDRILVLQEDNLEHSRIIRNQEQRIRDFEEQIKFVEVLKSYWWLIVIAFAIGAVFV